MIEEKIKTLSELALLIQDLREKNKGLRVGYTSGAFDLVHLGHVEYLEKAKELCDILLVGVNSDQSVKSYKSPLRPISSEASRIHVVASFFFVDYAFLFDEPNNQKNLLSLKPDLYIKAKDYETKTLSSAPLLESLGGKVCLVDFTKGHSTSDLVNTVLERYGYPTEGSTVSLEKKPAIFLDRDGVINKEIGYLSDFKDFVFEERVVEALRLLQEAKFRLFIVTNQAGIGLGYYTKEEFYEVNRKMLLELSKHQVFIDKIYFCPHGITDNCSCRKPKTGLFERAMADMPTSIEGSFLIGDKNSDIEAGKKMGLTTIKIESKYDKDLGSTKSHQEADRVFSNLYEAAKWIISR